MVIAMHAALMQSQEVIDIIECMTAFNLIFNGDTTMVANELQILMIWKSYIFYSDRHLKIHETVCLLKCYKVFFHHPSVTKGETKGDTMGDNKGITNGETKVRVI